MIALLLALILSAQGVALQSDNGTISGVLKTSVGQPAVGVRVAAMAVPESQLVAVTGAAMAALAETDAAGRYRLENIPPGRYYITAGRVDFPTYFPGALDMSAGTVVSVTAKATIADMNFALQDASIRTAVTDSNQFSLQLAMSVPIHVSVENGAKQPVSANGKFVSISLTRTADGLRNSFPLSGPVFNAPVSSALVGAEYRVTVDNLPDGYVLKSLSFGSTNLLTDTLKMTTTNFPQLTSNGNGLPLQGNVVSLLTILGNPGGTASPPPSRVATNAINVTLGLVPATVSSPPGVRVSGRAPVNGAWFIYRDDVPGTFYADGTFELSGVPPGRHIILMQDNAPPPQSPRFYAAVANVDNRNLDGVNLESTSILPTNFADTTLAAGIPASSGAQALAGLFGRVVEEADGRSVSQGSITILGRTRTTLPIGPDGKFDLPHLLPGSYDLRVEVYEHFILYETVVIDDRDIHVDLAVRSNLATPEERAASQAEPGQ